MVQPIISVYVVLGFIYVCVFVAKDTRQTPPTMQGCFFHISSIIWSISRSRISLHLNSTMLGFRMVYLAGLPCSVRLSFGRSLPSLLLHGIPSTVLLSPPNQGPVRDPWEPESSRFHLEARRVLERRSFVCFEPGFQLYISL